MKKYVKPVMECEEFLANEYIATCYLFTDTNVYVSMTDAPTDNSNTLLGSDGKGFADDGFDYLQRSSDGDGMPNGGADGFYGNEATTSTLKYKRPSELPYYTGGPYHSAKYRYYDNGFKFDQARSVYYYGKNVRQTQPGDSHPNAS